MATTTSAADLVAAGVQEACDDACSICLEAFSVEDPATLTMCNHSFHLQCVLEWAQRRPSIECPMCWQPLALQDATAAGLLAGVEAEAAAMRPASAPATFHHFAHQSAFQVPSDRHLEQHLLHHLAAAVSRSRHHVAPTPGGASNGRLRHAGSLAAPSSPPRPSLSTFSPPPGATLPRRSLPVPLPASPQEDSGSARGASAESFKARLAAATRGYRETAGPKISKGFRWLLSAFHPGDVAPSEAGPSSAPSSSAGNLHRPRPADATSPPAPCEAAASPSVPAPASDATPPSPPSSPPGESAGVGEHASSLPARVAATRSAGHQRSTSNLTRELQKMALEVELGTAILGGQEAQEGRDGAIMGQEEKEAQRAPPNVS